MTYSSNPRTSTFFSARKIKRERKRNKKSEEKWYLIATTMRGGFTIECRFPRGCVDKVILLRWRSSGKERRYREEETLWKPIKKFEKPWIAPSGTREATGSGQNFIRFD